MSRVPLPDEILSTKVIAVLRGLGPEAIGTALPALIDSGITVIEITLDSPYAVDSIRAHAGGATFVGAGTVRSIVDAAAAYAAGASFLVAPHTDPDVVAWAVEQQVPMIPGAFTPTEVVRAWDQGASAVKLFPASVGGPGMVRSISSPLADIPLIPTGGIDASNVADYLAAGAVAVGVGGWLTGSGDPKTIAARASQLVEAAA